MADPLRLDVDRTHRTADDWRRIDAVAYADAYVAASFEQSAMTDPDLDHETAVLGLTHPLRPDLEGRRDAFARELRMRRNAKRSITR